MEHTAPLITIAEAKALADKQVKSMLDGPIRGQLSPSAPQMRRIARHCNARRCPLCRRKAWDCRCG